MAEFVVTADPKAILPDEYKQRYKTFFQNFVSIEEIGCFMMQDGATDVHCSWIVEISSLIQFDSVLAFNTLNNPRLLLPLLEDAFKEFQEEIQELNKNWRKKNHVHIRFQGVPPLSEFSKRTIGDIKTNEISSIIQISGTIVRSSGVRMLEISKMYECQNPKCKYRFRVYADPEQDNVLPHPRSCPRTYLFNAVRGDGENRSGKNGSVEKKCNCVDLREVEEERICVDYQEIRVQDRIEHLAVGTVPRSMTVVLHADLVDRFNPGDDIIVIGLLIRQWRYLQRHTRSSIELTMQANNVMALTQHDRSAFRSAVSTVQFKTFWEDHQLKGKLMSGRNFIIRSICPQLYGMYFVKMSLLLALIGGVDTSLKGGIRRRSNIHMLMVGDPGCGKLKA
jgi:DNA helicase MCM9